MEDQLSRWMNQRISAKNLESSIMRSIQGKQTASDPEGGVYGVWLGRPALRYAAVVLLICLCGGLYYLNLRPPLVLQCVSAPPQTIFLNGAKHVILDEGLLLADDTVIHTREAQFLLPLGPSTQILFDKETQFKLLDPRHLELIQGRIHYRNQGATQEIVFNTERGQFIPMGTEFELTVSKQETMVSVFDGRVLFLSACQSQPIPSGLSLIFHEEHSHFKPVQRPRNAWFHGQSRPWIDYVRWYMPPYPQPFMNP